MPLRDHFRPPLYPTRHWESFHVTWAGAIADALNEDLLPEGYFAEEHAHSGAPVEIDVATFADDRSGSTVTATKSPRTYAPPVPAQVVPAAFPESFEVRVYQAEGGAKLVAAVELVSPGNKDREAHRRAFAVKCAGYLAQGVGLLLIDAVTTRHVDFHDAILNLLGSRPAARVADLYAVSYRPIVRDGGEVVELWTDQLAVGKDLPILPLSLSAELCVPIDLEATYTAAYARRRLP